MKNYDTDAHARGESMFVDDIPDSESLLHAAVYTSPAARGKITSLDLSEAKNSEGVVAVFTADDITGDNQIGGIIPDEPLLADGEVVFAGQPVAVVVARDRAAARTGASMIRIDIEELEPVFDPQEAASRGRLIAPSRTLSLGDIDAAWKRCDTVLNGVAQTGAQEHVYLETQGSIAIPLDRDKLKVIASTQAPTSVQKTLARVLDMPMNSIEVAAPRLGGAFGGKEDQATPWAALAALAAMRLGRPVKLVLSRDEDMRLTGKRHPYTSQYKIGLSEEGRILAFEATLYQNSGAAADLSTAILERSLFHATSSYFIPNVRVTAMACRTNIAPFTAFRGFGSPQAVYVIESAIDHAASAMGIDRARIQELNLLKEGDQFPYGMRAAGCRAKRCFVEAGERFKIAEAREAIRRFNEANTLLKRGLSNMPVCFGVSFTSTFLNQAGALVHVYTDGSASVATGAVEMGQGVNTKILGIAARALGISSERLTIQTTSTNLVANTSPTAASTGADMNGKAAQRACLDIVSRLKNVAARELGASPDDIEIRDDRVVKAGVDSGVSWEELVRIAYTDRVNLSAQAHYATPGIFYNKRTESGSPFAYHVFGTAVTQVTLDCLRGTYAFDSVRIVHDAGASLNPLIDRGQVEGGLVQGMGWLTTEEVLYSPEGEPVTNSLSTYKVPDIHFAPEITSVFLEDADNPAAVLSSKAIGEPPFLYGIGAFFALVDAMRAHKPGARISYVAPLTPERVLAFLCGKGCDEKSGGKSGAETRVRTPTQPRRPLHDDR